MSPSDTFMLEDGETMGAAEMSRFLRSMQIRESISTVALSHRPDCACDVCKATQGDDEAMMRVTMSLEGLR